MKIAFSYSWYYKENGLGDGATFPFEYTNFDTFKDDFREFIIRDDIDISMFDITIDDGLAIYGDEISTSDDSKIFCISVYVLEGSHSYRVMQCDQDIREFWHHLSQYVRIPPD